MTDETDTKFDVAHTSTVRGADALGQTHTETLTLTPKSDPAPPTASAQVRLRALEDHLFGEDCVRIRGQVERGYGSKFKEMTEPQAAHYAALEKLVLAEQKLDDARTAQIAAEAAAWAAAELASKTEAEIDAPAHE